MAWFATSPRLYRYKVVIPASKVGATLTDFPVYVDLSTIPSAHTFWGNVKKNGGDIIVTSSDGTTQLPLEVVAIDTVLRTGEIHFKATLTTSENTFYIYTGNSAATQPAVNATYGRNNVWSTYSRVFHLQEGTTGSAPQFVDSTGSGNNGTAQNLDVGDSAAGKVGKAVTFGGTDEYISTAGVAAGPTTFTMSGWFKTATTTGGWMLGFTGDETGSGGTRDRILYMDDDGTLTFGCLTADQVVLPATAYNDGAWHLAEARLSSAGQYLYIDGVSVGNIANTSAESVNNYLRIAYGNLDRWPGTHTSHYFIGSIDEVRLTLSERSANWIAATYANQNSPATFYNVTCGEQQGWYHENWLYRTKITIPAGKVLEELNGFVLYVNLADMGSGHNFWTHVKSDGGDIVATCISGYFRLPVCLVSIDTTAKTGSFYIKTPRINSLADTEIYLYYGNSSAAQPAVGAKYGRNSVWTDFAAVYHLNESSLTGAAGEVKDSTGTNDGQALPAGPPYAGPTPTTSGKLGRAFVFTGGDSAGLDYVNIGTGASLALTDNFEASVWVKAASNAVYYGALSKMESGGTYYNGWSIVKHSSNVFRITLASVSGTPATLSSDTAYTDTNWHHIVLRRAAGTTSMILDGVVQAATSAQAIAASTGYAAIGRQYNDFNQRYWDGTIDEVRISKVLHTVNWIKAVYANQNSSSTFYTVSATEETFALGWYNASWLRRVKIQSQASKVDEEINDYPAYYNLGDFGAYFWSYVKADLSDVVVTSCDGVSRLPLEVAAYVVASLTGELHFKAPVLRDDIVQTFYIYYSNAAGAEANEYSVWSNGYMGVWHLQDVAAINDSVGNLVNGTNSGTANGTGKISNAPLYDNDADYITVPDISAIQTATLITAAATTGAVFSFWVKSADVTSYAGAQTHIIGKGATNDKSYEIYWQTDAANNPLRLEYRRATGVYEQLACTKTDWANDTWYLAHVQYNGSTKAYSFSINGVAINSGTATYVPIAPVTSQSLAFGHISTAAGRFQGNIDEVRIARTTLTSTWISTEYNNQSSPSTFWGITVNLSVTDAGVGVSSVSEKISFMLADAGVGTSQLALINKLLVTQVGAGTELSNITAKLSQLDSAVGVEVISLLNVLSQLDAAIGTEFTGITVQFMLDDNGVHGYDTVSTVATRLSLIDTSLGASLIRVFVQLGIIDNAVGSEIVSVIARLTATDAGSGDDSVMVLAAKLTLIDAGLGAEFINTMVTVGIVDVATSTEIMSIFNQLLINDDGTPTDLVSVLSNIYLKDEGSGVDIIISAIVKIAVVDPAAAMDIVGIAVSLGIFDAAEGVEINNVLASVNLSDAGLSAESLTNIISKIVVDDSGSSTDEVSKDVTILHGSHGMYPVSMMYITRFMRDSVDCIGNKVFKDVEIANVVGVKNMKHVFHVEIGGVKSVIQTDSSGVVGISMEFLKSKMSADGVKEFNIKESVVSEGVKVIRIKESVTSEGVKSVADFSSVIAEGIKSVSDLSSIDIEGSKSIKMSEGVNVDGTRDSNRLRNLLETI